jgi:putative polyhydroxyalkanoate system protein
MATIDISRSHSLGLDAAKAKAEELAKGMEQKLGIAWRWVGNDITFEAASGVAKGASGKVKVDASTIQVAIDLPFMLKAMKSMVAQKVNDKLDALIGA